MALLIVDGTAELEHQWFEGVAKEGGDGDQVGAAEAACRALMALRVRFAPSHIAVVFDGAGPSFRTHLDPRYRAQRPTPPAELLEQAALLRQAAGALGCGVFQRRDFEADDLAATLIHQAAAQGLPATFTAAALDSLQLVREQPPVRIWDRGSLLDDEAVRARVGVQPPRVPDYLALAGDPPQGVVGAGLDSATALTLLEAFGDLEGLYADLRAVAKLPIADAAGLAQRLETGIAQVFLARELVTLRSDLDLGPEALESCAGPIDREAPIWARLALSPP